MLLLCLALNLESNSVGSIIFDKDSFVTSGTFVFRTYNVLKIPVGFELLGRVINSLGHPIDVSW